MTPPSHARTLAIWRSRVHREIDKCAEALASRWNGVSLHALHVDEDAGVAVARFHCFVPFPAGSSALEMIPLVVLDIDMSLSSLAGADDDGDVDMERADDTGNETSRERPQFPFQAPRVRVAVGAESLPRELRHKNPQTGECTLLLASLAHWTPSNTLVTVLQDFVRVVQQNDPQTETHATSDSASGATRSKRLRMRRRDVHGVIYHCQEVDNRTGTLRPAPLLLQSGNIVLLAPLPPSFTSSGSHRRAAHSSGPDDSEYLYVDDLFSLRDIARITPQRGRSITFFFKNARVRCRTLLTRQTEDIVADIQRMIAAAKGDQASNRGHSARATPTASDDGSSGSFAQLLSFLTPEQTEKAKEVSNKIVGKLSRWGSNVSRFFRGDDHDDDRHDQREGQTHASRGHRDRELLALDELKAQFLRYPSKARMVEITTRYQQLAETYAQRNARDGRVEMAIEELQSFIEHPTSQRILLEACEIDRSNQGIRVGPSTT
ncbi:hypothetical protein PINS_up004012 [Pythium insidiosum]|nr:hypothetical protein PINS_up004012 [Pythium insidiosum]